MHGGAGAGIYSSVTGALGPKAVSCCLQPKDLEPWPDGNRRPSIGDGTGKEDMDI